MEFSYFLLFVFLTTCSCALDDVVGVRHNQSATSSYNHAKRTRQVLFDKERDGPSKQRAMREKDVSLHGVRKFFWTVWTAVGRVSRVFCASAVQKEQPYTIEKGMFYLANRSKNTSVGPVIFPANNNSSMLITFYFRFIYHRARHGKVFYKPVRVLVRVWRGAQVQLIDYCDNKDSRTVGLRCHASRWPVNTNGKSVLCR